MSDISSIFQTSAATTTTETSSASSGADIMGKQDFLTLLVAQLQNQDPLNPDDPTEFTAQLAQFSSLEQLFNLNDSMDALADAQQQSERLTSMDLIGKEVVYQASSFEYDGTPVDLGYQLDGIAASVTITVQDENGAVVTTLNGTELSKGNHFIEWDGLDSDGNEVPEGKYKIILQASAGGEETSIAVSPLIRSEVVGVDLDTESGETILYTKAGSVDVAEILAAYEPGTTTDGTTETLASNSSEIARTAISTYTAESAPTDEEQIARDQLQHYLAGLN